MDNAISVRALMMTRTSALRDDLIVQMKRFNALSLVFPNNLFKILAKKKLCKNMMSFHAL